MSTKKKFSTIKNGLQSFYSAFYIGEWGLMVIGFFITPEFQGVDYY